jgi:hypothetical protein
MHRILWLAGLEPGFNRGGDVDTFRRYIYIHGVGEEITLEPMCGSAADEVAAMAIALGRGLWLTPRPCHRKRPPGVATIPSFNFPYSRPTVSVD